MVILNCLNLLKVILISPKGIKSRLKMPTNFTTDNDLLNHITTGDLDAFNILFERYWSKLYATIFSIYPDQEVCSEIVLNYYSKPKSSSWSCQHNRTRYHQSVACQCIEHAWMFRIGFRPAVDDT